VVAFDWRVDVGFRSKLLRLNIRYLSLQRHVVAFLLCRYLPLPVEDLEVCLQFIGLRVNVQCH
jgi:hypothetical protein